MIVSWEIPMKQSLKSEIPRDRNNIHWQCQVTCWLLRNNGRGDKNGTGGSRTFLLSFYQPLPPYSDLESFDVPADGPIFKEAFVISVTFNHALRTWVWLQRKTRELAV